MNATIIAQVNLIGSAVVGSYTEADRIILFLSNGKAAEFGVDGDDVTLNIRPITEVAVAVVASPALAMTGCVIEGLKHDVKPIRMTLNLSNGTSHAFHVADGKLILDAFEVTDTYDEDACPTCGRPMEDED